MPIKISGFVCNSCRTFLYCHDKPNKDSLETSGWMLEIDRLENNKVYCPTCTIKKINRVIEQTSKIYPNANYIQILEILAVDMREHYHWTNSSILKSVKSMFNYLKKGSKCQNTQRLQQKD